jgi:transcriptional regulator with XRE-family HTH domain
MTEIQKLIVAVRERTAARGARSQLARELKVKPARISDWLSGKIEPGGEITLQLQKWLAKSK